MSRLIVFDIDGTLVDSVHPHQTAFLNAVQNRVGSIENTNWSSYKDHTDSGIFRDILSSHGIDIQQNDQINDFDKEHGTLFEQIVKREPLKEIKGAQKFLEQLDDKGDFYCFATGSMKLAAIQKLAVVQNQPKLKLLATASEAQTREDIVRNAIDKAKRVYEVQSFEQIISVGDGLWDYKTAQNLKLEFCGIGHKLAEHLPNGIPLFNDFSEITSAF